MKSRQISQMFFVSLLALSLSACGWQLRGFNKGALPEALALKTADSYAPLARQLQQTLVRRGVTISASAPTTLWLDEEKQNKRIVAVTSIGSAAQYELIMEVDYKFITSADEVTLPKTINTQRIYDFTPGSNLAKVEEEQSLLREMRQELIERIIAQAPRNLDISPENTVINDLPKDDPRWRAGQEPVKQPEGLKPMTEPLP